MVAVAVAGLWSAIVNLWRLADAPALPDEWGYQRAGWNYWHWNSLPASLRTVTASNGEHTPLAKFFMGAAQVLVGHPSLSAARLTCALFSLATALAIGIWVSRLSTKWWGLAAATFYGTMPMSIYPDVTRFSRAAMLDTPATFFLVLSLVFCGQWFSATSRSWRWVIATGVSGGLAVACKEPAGLALVGPVLLIVVSAARDRSRRWTVVAQAAVAAGLAVVVTVVSFVPLGHVATRVHYLWRFQEDHSEAGHLVGVAGHLTRHPAWWANFWFAQRGLGLALSVTFVIVILLALFVAGRRIWFFASSLVAPVIFFCVIEGMALAHYWVMWVAPVVMVTSIGGYELAQHASRLALPRLLAISLAALAMVAFVIPSVEQTTRVLTLQPIGPQRVAEIRGNSTALVLVGAMDEVYLTEYRPYLPAAALRLDAGDDLAHVGWVVVGHSPCPRPPIRRFRALVADAIRSRSLRLVYVDRLVSLYKVTKTLHSPSAARVASLPDFPASQLCRGT